MSSLLDYTFFWGSQTPTGMAGISTNGPSSVPFACTPLYASQYFTFTWYQLGNGCPYEYSWNPLSTCISTAGGYNTMTWGCTWTTSTAATSTVDGGTTTAAPGQAATSTAPAVWVTVTSTQQTTTTTTSVVDPGAKTVTVTSTQGVQRRDDEFKGAAQHYGMDLQETFENDNSTYGPLDSRAVCAAADINCGLNCCYSDQTCIAGGTYPCCNGWACVPYNPKEPFTGNIYWSWHGATATSTIWSTLTTYSTVNAPGSTITITPTSTTSINVVQTQTAIVTVTTNDPIVTVTSIVQVSSTVTGFTGNGGVVKTGGSVSSAESVLSVSVSGGVVVTSGGSTFTTGGTSVTYLLPPQTATNTPSGNATVTKSNNDLVVKVAAGVGTPLGVCLIGLLIFFIYRHQKKKSPKSPPPDIIGGDAEAMESTAAGGASAYYSNAEVASKPIRPATIIEHHPQTSPNSNMTYAPSQGGYDPRTTSPQGQNYGPQTQNYASQGQNYAPQGYAGYGPGPTSPTSQHSQEMYVPPNRYGSPTSQEMYAAPPRYASPPRFVSGEGPGEGYYVNEAETMSNRHELGGRPG